MAGRTKAPPSVCEGSARHCSGGALAATTPLTEGRAPQPLNSYKAKKAKIITTKYIAISV